MQYTHYKRHIVYILLFLIHLEALGQVGVDVDKVSDAQVEQFLEEMEARGMSEQEIEAAARLNGYSSTDIAKIRQRINRLKSGSTDTTQTISDQTRKQIGEVAERTDLEVNETDEEEVVQKLEVFGKSLFKNKALTFEPNLRLPTPSNYLLGPDDEIKIDITGFAYQHYDLSVSPEGTISIESLSPISVSGLTVKEAKRKITERLKTLFGGLRSGGGLSLDLTLGDVRSIQVTVLGEVEKPGTYTVSSFATAMNALYLSGGPTKLGSFRNIRVLRNNQEIGRIDLYEFLTSGKFSSNPLLQDQDVLFIPVADKKIKLQGQVQREMIFEVKSNESLLDAIGFAGGFTGYAYQKSLRVKRYTDTEQRILSVFKDDLDDFLIKNGDEVNVEAVLERFENRVEVIGAVFRPGEYALGKAIKSLGSLIEAAEGLREDAFKNRVLIQRENENLDIEVISLDLREPKSYDFELQREDIVSVKSLSELREERLVSISGAIVQEGEYEFKQNLSVNDLIVMAGGLATGAETGNIEVARRISDQDIKNQNIEIIPFQSSEELMATGTELILQPFDQVYIRQIANYQVQQTVSITGEVKYPGTYAISKRDEKISDLVKRAGGVTSTGQLEGARFFKGENLVALNLQKVIDQGSSIGNLILQNGDSLHIPKLEDYVVVSGEVLNPTVVAYNKAFDFNDYIAQAGGYTDSAFVRKAYVRYANGLTDRSRSFMGFSIRPESQRGMELVVPKRNKYRWTPAERIAVSSAFVSIATIMVTLVRLL